MALAIQYRRKKGTEPSQEVICRFIARVIEVTLPLQGARTEEQKTDKRRVGGKLTQLERSEHSE